MRYFCSFRFIRTDWEFDALLRRRVGQNLAKAVDSLSSLFELLDTVTQIPVKGDMAQAMKIAFDHIFQVAIIIFLKSY